METIGQILKNAREKKGLTIEELASSTYIVAKFIKALEDEQFDLLPGEIYVKGFIKNLSDKLSLDSDAMIERYNLQRNENKFEEDLSKSRKFKISAKKKEEKIEKAENKKEEIKESDNEDSKEEKAENKKEIISKTNSSISVNSKTYTPNSAEAELLYITKRDLNKLRNKKSKPNSFVPVIMILAILVIFAVIFFNIDNIKSMFSSNKNNNKREVEIARNIVDNNARQNVKSGDIIYFKPLGISATIKFNSIGNVIRMNINGQDLSFSKSNPIILDLNGNGINDFKISIIEVYDNLATVEMEKLEENQMINSVYNNEESTNYLNDVTNNIAVSSDVKLPVIDGETYIEQDTEKSNIRIEITAKHFVYLRYFIDSGGPATTNLLSGKTLYLEARDVMMLTIGNAGEVVVKVNGKIVDVGALGETVNKTIKWTKNLNDSTKYNLIMTDTK
ncbi:helix-turn-helix domain-containing protein [Brachyspira pilosicoli]|uniref:helix-turn-helix domain-containing protein n=1 Tax=Brachyspira pilosicoli TaxID=52584 RepID=UPI0030059B29